MILTFYLYLGGGDGIGANGGDGIGANGGDFEDGGSYGGHSGGGSG